MQNMNRSVLFIAFVVVFGNVLASAATTNSGYPACLKKEWLDDLVQFSISKDNNSWKAYMNSGKCLMMKGGLKVTVTESPGVFGGTTGFIFEGTKAWTLREAINY